MMCVYEIITIIIMTIIKHFLEFVSTAKLGYAYTTHTHIWIIMFNANVVMVLFTTFSTLFYKH